MGGSSSDIIIQTFNEITHAVYEQQKLMERLEEENQELRRQLTHLRAGYHVFLEIEGRRFPLLTQNDATAQSMSTPTPVEAYTPPLVEAQTAQEPAQEEEIPTESDQSDVTEAPTIAMSEVAIQPVAEPELASEIPLPRSVPTAQLPREDEEEIPQQAVHSPSFLEEEVPQQATYSSSFLEEVMLDEFAAAATSPMAVWTGPIAPVSKKQETLASTEEEKKAALRRELMGSYLLE